MEKLTNFYGVLKKILDVGGLVIMGNEINVLLVDDNKNSITVLNDFLSKQPRIKVVGLCEDGQQCLEFINNNHVDVVILDMIMPKLDGIGVLEKSQYMNLGNRPSFFILSSLRNESMIAKACELGARYYMIKPYDSELLYSRIVQLFDEKKASLEPDKGYGAKSFTSLDEKITSVFLMVGIPAHIKGFHYLREGVRLVMEDSSYINKITKELYPEIAKRFETTPSKVERAIRHAIEVAWNRGKIENINHVFGYQIYGKNDKPTNGEFIALMADRLSMQKV